MLSKKRGKGVFLVFAAAASFFHASTATFGVHACPRMMDKAFCRLTVFKNTLLWLFASFLSHRHLWGTRLSAYDVCRQALSHYFETRIAPTMNNNHNV
jgi:hypothetical protein